MSGAEFEHYMAKVYEALGYNATILGGTGDQGVDLLLRKGPENVVVQCKNHQRPVNNLPIQQVFAGRRYYGAKQAWVVAPAGFTKGAFALARSTGVLLFDYDSIKKLIQRAEQQQTEPTSPEDQGLAPPQEQGGRHINLRDSQTKTTTSGNNVVGDTATIPSGDRLTLHSYESPVVPLTHWQPDEGYEFAAIDIEWCATPAMEENRQANAFYFNLHLPDNTRLRMSNRQIKEPGLAVATIAPGDCVRGWVTFQKPKGMKPNFVIFSREATLVKWALQ